MSTTTRRIGDAVEILAIILSGYACHLYYNLVGHLASLRGVDFGPFFVTALDQALPYGAFWVHFYQIAYFMPSLVLLSLFPRIGLDVTAYRRMVFSFLCLLFTHYVLYLAVPTSARAIRLSPEALGGGLLGDLVRYQYRLATVWCAWPSLHVSACWYFYRLFARKYPTLRWIYLAWFAGMFVSTAAIKIHYALDAVTGFLLGEAAFTLVLVRLERSRAFAWSWRNETLRAVVHLGILALLFAGLPFLIRLSGYQGALYTIGN